MFVLFYLLLLPSPLPTHHTLLLTLSASFPPPFLLPLPPPSLTHRIEHSTSIPSTSYEFPNGYSLNATVEKFKLTEGLFNAGSANIKVCVCNRL